MTMTRNDFLSALSFARRGDRVTYHTGLLMADRRQGATFQAIHGAACAAWDACTQGVCTLVQRRIDRGTCDYIAVKL